MPRKDTLPAIRPKAQVPAIQRSPSFFQAIQDGVGFGIGSSIAHTAVRSLLAPAQEVPKPAPTQTKITLTREFIQCMKESNNNIDGCSHLLEDIPK
jgi:hypothetical protein